MIDHRLKLQHPAEPWRWRRDWIEKRVRHSHVRDGLFLLLFAAIWNAVIIPMLLFARGGAVPSAIRWLLYAFAGFGVVMMAGSLRAVLIGLRHGHSSLVLQDVPQRLGRRFSAALHMRRLPKGEITATVECRQKPRPGGGHHVLHREARVIDRQSVREMADGWVIPIEFSLPGTAPETQKLNEPGEITWIVFVMVGPVMAPVVRGDYPIPVFGGQAKPEDEFDMLLDELPDEVRRRIKADLASSEPGSSA